MGTKTYIIIMLVCLGIFIAIGKHSDFIDDSVGDFLFIIGCAVLWPITFLVGIPLYITHRIMLDD